MKKKNSYSLLSFSFKKGFTSPNLPITTFMQGDKKLNFLLDTGSDMNTIDKNVVEKLQYRKIDDTVTHVTGVGGRQTVESCIIEFSYGDKKFETEFLITDLKEAFGHLEDACGIPLHGLIGSSFLRENNLILDFQNLTAYDNDTSGD